MSRCLHTDLFRDLSRCEKTLTGWQLYLSGCVCVCVCVCARASAGSRVIISYLWFSPQIELILSLFFLLTFILKLFILFWHIADYRAFPGSSAGKESACRAGDLSSIPELGGSPGEGKAYPLPYSVLFCFSFPWGWSWSLSPAQCHAPHSIVHQAIYLSDLGP